MTGETTDAGVGEWAFDCGHIYPDGMRCRLSAEAHAMPGMSHHRHATPAADDASTGASEGLSEAERHEIVKALYDFPHAGAKWLTFRDGVYATVEGILAARVSAAATRAADDRAERIAQAISEQVVKAQNPWADRGDLIPGLRVAQRLARETP